MPSVFTRSPIKELSAIVQPETIPPMITIRISVSSRAFPILISENFLMISAIISVPPELELTQNISALAMAIIAAPITAERIG